MPRTRYVFKTTRELPTRKLDTGEVGSHTVRLRHRMPWLCRRGVADRQG